MILSLVAVLILVFKEFWVAAENEIKASPARVPSGLLDSGDPNGVLLNLSSAIMSPMLMIVLMKGLDMSSI